MASNYNRKSSTSGLRRDPRSQTSAARSSSSRLRPSRSSRPSSGYRSAPGQVSDSRSPVFARNAKQTNYHSYQPLSSVRVGDINRAVRAHRVQKTYRRYVVRVFVALAFIALLLTAGIIVYNSSLFTISNIAVKGVEHLTATDMTELASVPAGTTLLRVDEAGIKNRLFEEAWVESVGVNRLFPDTLELVITERRVAAVVEVPVDNAQKTENWAIASDGKWLMAIPAEGSEEAATVSIKVYEDAASALRITGVPYGLKPLVGDYCSDDNVNNALSVVAGLTTGLADQVKTVSATGTETTTLILGNGVEIAFGTAENIREKERICLQLIEENPDKIAYINVHVAESPTWRSL